MMRYERRIMDEMLHKIGGLRVIGVALMISAGLAGCIDPLTPAPRVGETDVASATPEAEAAPAAKKPGLGLLGRGNSTGAVGVATDEVSFGQTLPFGAVARLCGVPKSRLGREVARHPDRGPKYRLYDSAPGTTGPHTMYLTGFSDGCARQFTGGLAVFGEVAMHEQLRYGLPAKVQPYSDTDKAYEKIKFRICGVGRKKPCGRKLSRLERGTVFVSVYEQFGGNGGWSNLLLHDGTVAATDIKKR